MARYAASRLVCRLVVTDSRAARRRGAGRARFAPQSAIDPFGNVLASAIARRHPFAGSGTGAAVYAAPGSTRDLPPSAHILFRPSRPWRGFRVLSAPPPYGVSSLTISEGR